MKKRITSVIASLLLSVAGMQTAFAQMIKINLVGNQTLKYNISQVESIEFEEEAGDGHEYVEIGGIKWATKNVGATTVAGSYATCCGDYFAWGETETYYATMTHTAANAATFTWKEGYEAGYDISTYHPYTDATLDASHDAATAAWGEGWRTPTLEEFKALAIACAGYGNGDYYSPLALFEGPVTEGGIYWLSETQTFESEYTGVAGMLFVCADDISKRVFFPAAGGIGNTYLSDGGKYGDYWSSSLYTSKTNSAYRLDFSSSSVYPSSYRNRVNGYPVRPVSD